MASILRHSDKRVRNGRNAREGGSYRDTIPLANDDFLDVHARDGRLLKVGSLVATAPTTRETQKTQVNWRTAKSWAPLDNPEYALDPNGDWYDEAVERPVMAEDPPPPTRISKKKLRSKVSKRPHVVWKELYRGLYLDELCRFSCRGDFRTANECPDCLSRKAEKTGAPEYRCKECFTPDLACASCCIRRHRIHPLHRIEKWNGTHFVNVSLMSMGLKVQLNHGSMYCENPVPCHSSMLVLHTNGFHEVAFNYCGCARAIPQHVQLLRRHFYPASQIIVKTCASFELLNLLHKLALTTKASTYDFYRALDKLTNNTGLEVPKSRYRSLFRMILQWRHLKLLRWAGRGHDPMGPEATKPGELGLRCPSCPYPDINLPQGWESAPIGARFLYTMFVCMDANFRLKNQLVSNYSQDPGLGIGMAYMVPREPYEAYVLSRANDEDISTCVGFQALAQANNRFSKGLRYTGVGGVFCGRSEMILPLGIGNLQKGERYANMDYVFASAVRNISLPLLLISYDIACQWFINLFVRMTSHWPEELRIPSTTTIIPAIPKLHEPMHQAANHQVFSLNYLRGVGLSDFECPERGWAAHNAVGNATKSQGPGSRHDVLDDHFSFWNWLKYIGMGKTLSKKYATAIAERNIQVEAHRGLTAALDKTVVEKWERLCAQWDDDVFPKTEKNPYETEGVAMTEAQAKKELALQEEERLAAGGVAIHTTSASAFVVMGLDIEDTQRRLRRLAKATTSRATARQAGGLTEQRNQLTTRIRIWEQLLPLYIPGLLQYKADLRAQSRDHPKVAEHPEDIELWLPHRLPAPIRNRLCSENLPAIKEKLRTAQCSDTLETLRHVLKMKSRLVKFKNKNVRGQREGTRSRAVIDRVHDRARATAEKYRAARAAKLLLSGPGDWERDFRVLADADIRGYQDPNHLRQRMGRRGTLEDDQVEGMIVDTPLESDEFTLFVQDRSRRDGTGETRRTLSWIWSTSIGMDDPENVNDDILRSEWAKSRARAARAQEEVQLVREEMRRVLEFLEWKAKWWMSYADLRTGDSALLEGLRSYVLVQADLQRSLANSFRDRWQKPLGDLEATRANTHFTGPSNTSANATASASNADSRTDDRAHPSTNPLTPVDPSTSTSTGNADNADDDNSEDDDYSDSDDSDEDDDDEFVEQDNDYDNDLNLYV